MTTKVTYEVVEHDGGWAYRVNGVYSETFRPMPRPMKRPNEPPASRSRPERRPATPTRTPAASGTKNWRKETIAPRRA